MKPLGIDLLGINPGDDGMSAPFIPPRCPGARLLLTRDDLSEMVRGGEHFEQDGTFVPPGGRGYARVRCGNIIVGWKGVAGHVVYAGLCPSCSGLEVDNRALLRGKTP